MDPVTPFAASNGVGVRLDGTDLDILNGPTWIGLCGGVVVDALREFFRAEEDERLGRWRWAENPDYLVYATESAFLVVDEKHPRKTPDRITRTHLDDPIGSLGWGEYAARAFFAAHPVPKPAWHDAVDGEAWVVTYEGREFAAIFFHGLFRNNGGSWDAASLTAGRRIWPEEVSS